MWSERKKPLYIKIELNYLYFRRDQFHSWESFIISVSDKFTLVSSPCVCGGWGEMVDDGILVRLKWKTILRSSKSIQDCVKSKNLVFSNVFSGFRGLLEDLGDFYYKKRQGVKFTRHVHTYYDILKRCYTHIGPNFLYFHWKQLISRNNAKVDYVSINVGEDGVF